MFSEEEEEVIKALKKQKRKFKKILKMTEKWDKKTCRRSCSDKKTSYCEKLCGV